MIETPLKIKADNIFNVLDLRNTVLVGPTDRKLFVEYDYEKLAIGYLNFTTNEVYIREFMDI